MDFGMRLGVPALVRVLVVVANLRLAAQTTLGVGAVGGHVQDESGAFVAGAKITLTEAGKGLNRQSESSNGGAFLFPSVIAGVYALQVEKDGFTTQLVEGLEIEVGTKATLAITLRVGGISSAITVRPPSTIDLDAESNLVGTVVDSSQVQQLPLNGRNFLQLALLAGGTKEVTAASDLYSGNVGPPARNVVLPGVLPHAVGYSLNGINVRGARDGDLALSPSVAAVDQFKVQSSFLMPDQGPNAAVVNIVTKSGSNHFHGEAYQFFRNRIFDARSFFASSREDLKRNQFGIAAGGPLQKNRVWFHGFFEVLREITAFATAGYSPTAAMFGGDFAVAGRAIYDPATYSTVSRARQPFPAATIPPNRVNQVANNLLEYYLPGASLTSRPSNLFGNPRKTLDDNQGGFRVDAELNQKSQLFAQVFFQSSPSVQPGLYPLSGLLYINDSQLAMMQHVWSLSPKTVNSLRIGFVRNAAIGANQGRNEGPLLPEIGVMNTFERNGITAINLQGYSSFGRSNGEIGNRDHSWQLDEEFTYVTARHSLAFGSGLRYRRGWHLNGNTVALGALSFQSAFTAQVAQTAQGQFMPTTGTGDSFADFLLGFPVNGLVIGLPAVQFRSTQISPFVQDTWRLTRNLTLNYGLSWFLDTFPNPHGWARKAVHGFDDRTGLVRYAELGEVPAQAADTDKNNFASRLGIAWKPRSVGATVIRAGVGLFYSELAWFMAPYPITSGSPYTLGRSFTNPVTEPAPGYALGLNVFPEGSAVALTSSYAANLPAGTVVTALNRSLRTAYLSQWNVSLQHGLTEKDSIEVAYLGSSGHRLANPIDLSQCRPSATLFCDPASRPWPRYGLVLYGDSSGNSSYSALIAKYEHRMSNGLGLRFEYAFAKALTDSWQTALSINNQISRCRSCSKGPANFDVRHRVVGSILWPLPFGTGRRYGAGVPSWLDGLIGQWSFTGIWVAATGQPVVLRAPNQTGSMLTNHLPNRVCDGRSPGLSGNIRSNGFLWFDTRCFPVPPVGFFGNSGPTVLNGPALHNWDLGVEKGFPIARDSARLQVRAEMFNAWNHAQFQQPNGDSGAGANFGRISSTRPPRVIQIALKLNW
jgi:hypothetical protein